MAIIALKLLKEAEKNGWAMKVRGSGEDATFSAVRAWNLVKSVEEAVVSFYTSAGGVAYRGCALLMAPGPMSCADDETIVDYSAEGPVAEICDRLVREIV